MSNQKHDLQQQRPATGQGRPATMSGWQPSRHGTLPPALPPPSAPGPTPVVGGIPRRPAWWRGVSAPADAETWLFRLLIGLAVFIFFWMHVLINQGEFP